MENRYKSQERWLDTAVSGIRFGLDQREVRAELEGHIEDKMADLKRIFPDIPPDEARERALAGMGDPEELKVRLARIHRPWLGWLGTASRWMFCILLLISSLLGMSIKFGMENRSLRGSTNYGVVHRIQGGEKAELGQYTFQITGAACLEYPDREAELQVALRASSPRFWERINPRAVVDNMTVVGPDGTRYAADSYRPADGSEQSDHTVWGDLFSEWGPCWKEVSFFLPAEGWQPGDRVTLELDSKVGRIVLSTAVTERVKMP